MSLTHITTYKYNIDAAISYKTIFIQLKHSLYSKCRLSSSPIRITTYLALNRYGSSLYANLAGHPRRYRLTLCSSLQPWLGRTSIAYWQRPTKP